MEKKTISLNQFLSDESVFVDAPYLGGLSIRVRRRAVCADGFSISIQASEEYYSEASGEPERPYKSVQVGYPNKKEPLLKNFEFRDIYPYVPIEIVEKIIKKHGGIVGAEILTETGAEYTPF